MILSTGLHQSGHTTSLKAMLESRGSYILKAELRGHVEDVSFSHKKASLAVKVLCMHM